jgi:hypothetical protein
MAMSHPPATFRGVFLFVIMLAGLVYCFAPSEPVAAREKAAKSKPPAAASTSEKPLPAAVVEMQEAILAAVRSGNIEDLQTALEWNELKPMVATEPVADPIVYWKKVSRDGQGREILAILGNILEAGHVALPLGKDIENNLVYVWPAVA